MEAAGRGGEGPGPTGGGDVAPIAGGGRQLTSAIGLRAANAAAAADADADADDDADDAEQVEADEVGAASADLAADLPAAAPTELPDDVVACDAVEPAVADGPRSSCRSC